MKWFKVRIPASLQMSVGSEKVEVILYLNRYQKQTALFLKVTRIKNFGKLLFVLSGEMIAEIKTTIEKEIIAQRIPLLIKANELTISEDRKIVIIRYPYSKDDDTVVIFLPIVSASSAQYWSLEIQTKYLAAAMAGLQTLYDWHTSQAVVRWN